MMLDDLNEQHPLRGTGCSNSDDAASLPRHKWYFVKEAFSPRVVERAIDESGFGADDILVDPFCGSGTVPLTSSLKKHQAVGFEVNPFLAFVARTKLQHCLPSTIEHHSATVKTRAGYGKTSSLETYSSFSEAGGSEKWLFNKEVLRSFEGGWSATTGLQAPVRDLLRLSLIGAAMDSCNAFKDGKGLRYRSKWQELNFGRDHFVSAFEKRIADIKTDVVAAPNPISHGTIQLADSRSALRTGIADNFKLCVTSPPYLNSFDYSDVYRPELFLGKFVRSSEDLRLLRQKTVRSHIQAKWDDPKEHAFGTLYKQAVLEIREREDHLWNKRIPLMIQAYFEDIEKVLRDLRLRAKPDASLWLVVSTSAYVGVEIPVDLITAYIGNKVGWYLREVGVLRHLRCSGQRWNRWATDDVKPRLRESVVVFDASRLH